MSWLLDTCVLSELAQAQPDEAVVSWINAHAEEDLYLSVLTLGEIEKAIAKVAPTSRRTELETWLRTELAARFAGRLLPIDAGVVTRWGSLVEAAEAEGKPLALIDGLIAATGLQHDMTVATRDVDTLARCGARCVNPWQRTAAP